jgi:hypothetical protein
MTAPNTVDPQIRELARRLIAHETAAGDSSGETASPLVRVFDTFRRLLTTLIGPVGFRALLERALTLAKIEAPQLKSFQVTPDGSLKSSAQPLGQGQTTAADVVLITHFIGLFATFIGKDLMLNLVQGAWPDLPVSGVELGRKNDHESAQ